MKLKSTQSPDFNLTEILWRVLKQMPPNLNELKQWWKEEWPSISSL